MDETISDEKSENKNPVKDNKIFKIPFPLELFWEFLSTNFTENDTHIQINAYLFRKTEYNQTLNTFIITLKPYYYRAKIKYIERQMNYKCFLTIIRQLCNAHNIKYNKKLVYNKSTYEIEYSIYK